MKASGGRSGSEGDEGVEKDNGAMVAALGWVELAKSVSRRGETWPTYVVPASGFSRGRLLACTLIRLLNDSSPVP
jgi:hypothetical protein